MTETNDAPALPQIQAELLQIISEVLGQDLPTIPSDTPILDFVVSSLALVEGMRRVYEHFGVLISIRRVIEGQATLGGIAAYIEQELQSQRSRASAAPMPSPEPPLVAARRVRLAPSQQHVGFLARYSGEAAAAFNEAVAVRLEGPIDAPALQAAVDAVAARYEALHTALSPDEDELSVQPGQPLEVLVSPCHTAQLEQRLAEIGGRPFAPGERLFRAELLRLAEGEHVLVMVSHALVVEAEALDVVLEELAGLYTAYSQDRAPATSFPALQWTDYLSMGQAEPALRARDIAQAFWRAALAKGWPRLELPSDLPRPRVKRYAGDRLALSLEPDLFARLHDWAQAQGLAAADVVLSAYGVYLSRLAGQQDLAVGVRSAPLYLDPGQRVVAQTRNMLPLRLSVDPLASFAQQVRAVSAGLAQAEQSRHFSLAEMIQLLNPARDQSRSPIFTAAFQQRQWAAAPTFGLLRRSLVPVPAPGARYDVELRLLATPDAVQLVIDYSTELFRPETVARWLAGLSTLLRAGLDDPETACGRLPMMPAQERAKLLWDWNRTETAYPRDKTVLDLIVAQALARPTAPAIRFQDRVMTYEKLLERVQALAALLHRQGVVAGDRVGILLERSPDIITAVLAAWRLGALYVPLDPGFPGKRLEYMLGDAGVRATITSRGLLPLVPDGFAGQAVFVDDLDDQPPSLDGPFQPARAQGSAYIIYTSGSTGQPKGVEVGHQGLVNCLLAVQTSIGFKAGHVLLAITTPAFDISTVELLMPLIAGGVVDIAPDDVVADGVSLAEMVVTHKPDFMQATPSVWKMMLAAGWQGDSALCLCSGGESLSRELAEQLVGRGRVLWNLFGPTETTVWSSAGQVVSAPDQPVSIGRPLANTHMYVLDAQLELVPLGAIGELYIGGDGLARGYWRKPELTAGRFVPDPVRSGERLCRTGDLARYLPDGSLLCLGRIDDQVKIHGVRVELGEVEAALSKVAGIRDAVVTAWRDPRGDAQLVAHVVVTTPPGPSAAEIRAQLREELPEFMLPPYILFAEAFPLTATGKIRRVDLPTPDTVQRSAAAATERPETPSERLLAKAWSDVLGLDPALIGRNSDFMDLGGHSLLMTPLMLEVRRLFQVSFSLREFFAASTLRTCADLIDKRRRAQSNNGHGSRPATPVRGTEWGRQRMAFLLREAGLPPSIAPARGMSYRPASDIHSVFLTGGTGFLGAYLVAEILSTTRAQVYCLVRPKRGQDGKARIEKTMRGYGVWREPETGSGAWHSRLHAVEGDVSLPRLGMADRVYETLAREVDAIVHGAAHVNFIYPYEALRATNVLGLHEIIRFAFDARIKPLHHLSTAAIWPMGAQNIFYEKDPIEHGQVLNLGYDEAKWVGERCLLYAEERGLPVARYRPGEVGGDSLTGRCVTDHFVVAAVKGFVQFGAFPALDIEIDVAPIDYVARAMTYLAFQRNPLGRAFHLTNPTRMHTSAALTYLRSEGYRFDEMRFVELRDRLLSSPDFGSNALFAYQAVLEDMDDISLQLPTYDTRETQRELEGSGIACPPADEKLFGLYLDYLQGIGFMPQPERVLTPI
jgi:myxalamid-type nonribosomal peptide synthetase MxaA